MLLPSAALPQVLVWSALLTNAAGRRASLEARRLDLSQRSPNPAVANELVSNDLDKRITCYEDDYLLSLQMFIDDSYPSCSEYLGIPQTTTYETARVTATLYTLVTKYSTHIVRTDVPAATATVTATAGASVVPRGLEARQDGITPAATLFSMCAQETGLNASLISAVSSACSCLFITESVVVLTSTTTKTRTISGIDYEDTTVFNTVPYGTTTTTVTLNPSSNSVPSVSATPTSPVASPTGSPSFNTGGRSDSIPTSPATNGGPTTITSTILIPGTGTAPSGLPSSVINATFPGSSGLQTVTVTPPTDSSVPAPTSSSSVSVSIPSGSLPSSMPSGSFMPTTNVTSAPSGSVPTGTLSIPAGGRSVGSTGSISMTSPTSATPSGSIQPSTNATISTTATSATSSTSSSAVPCDNNGTIYVTQGQSFLKECYINYDGPTTEGLTENSEEGCVDDCAIANVGFSQSRCYAASYFPAFVGPNCFLKTEKDTESPFHDEETISYVLLTPRNGTFPSASVTTAASAPSFSPSSMSVQNRNATSIGPTGSGTSSTRTSTTSSKSSSTKSSTSSTKSSTSSTKSSTSSTKSSTSSTKSSTSSSKSAPPFSAPTSQDSRGFSPSASGSILPTGASNSSFFTGTGPVSGGPTTTFPSSGILTPTFPINATSITGSSPFSAPTSSGTAPPFSISAPARNITSATGTSPITAPSSPGTAPPFSVSTPGGNATSISGTSPVTAPSSSETAPPFSISAPARNITSATGTSPVTAPSSSGTAPPFSVSAPGGNASSISGSSPVTAPSSSGTAPPFSVSFPARNATSISGTGPVTAPTSLGSVTASACTSYVEVTTTKTIEATSIFVSTIYTTMGAAMTQKR